MWITAVILCGLVTLLTLLWLKIKWLQALSLPNARSSHTKHTPAGAGIVFASVAIGFLITLNAPFFLLIALLLATTIGYLDDFLELSARYKLIGIVLSAFCLLKTFDNMPMATFFAAFPLPVLLILLLITLVWFINLVNFIDGINGILAVEMIFLLLALNYFAKPLGLVAEQSLFLPLAAVYIGFLPFNFPRAKLFMGDAGSLFSGVLVGYFFLKTLWSTTAVLIFLALFALCWVDASVTLLSRLRAGQNIFQAHKSHLYQYLANHFFKSHTKTVLFYALLHVVYLLPFAYTLSQIQVSVLALLVFILGLLPIVLLVLWANRLSIHHH